MGGEMLQQGGALKAKGAAIRERKFNLVRDEILRAASVLFAVRGYRAVTTNDIADQLGFTKSAMYYYFSNKYDILSTIFRESFGYYLKQARAIVAQQRGPQDILRDLTIQHTLNALERREWTIIYFRDESELDERDRAHINKCRKEYAEFFARAYADGVRTGAFRDIEPSMVVYGIIGACNSIAVRHRNDDPASYRSFAEQVADLIARGFLVASTPARSR
jgi:AcrR family transcriptional regulator